MKTKVGINGFGRIGRNAFRVAFDRPDIEIAGINDITDTKTLAYLLKHDTAYGAYHHEVGFDENNIIVEGIKIPVSAEKDPADIPWGNLGAEIIIESTGRFTTREAASAHLKAGAKKVITTAPDKSGDVTTIMIGANEDKLATCGDIISNASCTTNSVAAIMDVIDREYGIEKAMLTTVHSYTASQVLQDGPAKDLREGRAAAENIVPTTTGAAFAVAQTVPNLKGKFDGLSIRVPSLVVSLSDITMIIKRDITKDELNEFFISTSKEPYYQGIIGVTEEELVSKDFVGNSFSGIIDLHLTNVVAGNMIKVVVWYDNEWGYSNRLVELVADVGKLMSSGKIDKSAMPTPNVSKTEVNSPESAKTTQPEAPEVIVQPVQKTINADLDKQADTSIPTASINMINNTSPVATNDDQKDRTVVENPAIVEAKPTNDKLDQLVSTETESYSRPAMAQSIVPPAPDNFSTPSNETANNAPPEITNDITDVSINDSAVVGNKENEIENATPKPPETHT